MHCLLLHIYEKIKLKLLACSFEIYLLILKILPVTRFEDPKAEILN